MRYSYAVAFKLCRQWRPYFYRIYVTSACITSCAFGVYALPAASSLADRQSTILTLLLTMVAFMFIISATIPNVPYLTLVHKFTNGCVGLLFVIFCQSSIIAAVDPESHDVPQIDSICAWVFALSWIMFLMVHAYQCYMALHLEFNCIKLQTHTQYAKESNYWFVESKDVFDNREKALELVPSATPI